MGSEPALGSERGRGDAAVRSERGVPRGRRPRPERLRRPAAVRSERAHTPRTAPSTRTPSPTRSRTIRTRRTPRTAPSTRTPSPTRSRTIRTRRTPRTAPSTRTPSPTRSRTIRTRAYPADGALDPNAIAEAQPYDPNVAYPAGGLDPNALFDEQPYDPNAAYPGDAALDPDALLEAQPYDPNALPEAQPLEPSTASADGEALEPGTFGDDPASGAEPQPAWEAAAQWDASAVEDAAPLDPLVGVGGAEEQPSQDGDAIADVLDAEVEAEPLEAEPLEAEGGALSPAGWDAEPPLSEPTPGASLGEYDEVGGPGGAGDAGLTTTEDSGIAGGPAFELDSASLPDEHGATPLGEYDDTAGFIAMAAGEADAHSDAAGIALAAPSPETRGWLGDRPIARRRVPARVRRLVRGRGRRGGSGVGAAGGDAALAGRTGARRRRGRVRRSFRRRELRSAA